MRYAITTGWLKFLVGWAAVFAFRFILLPFRPPNVEPMMATLMPFSKRYGFLGSFLFAFVGIVAYDAVTSGWGVWTLITACAYGVVGILSHIYFKHREATTLNFISFGIVGTLFYDAITGLSIGPIFWHQSFMSALVGQIPFTLMHLTGTVAFSAILSPALYRWVVQNEVLEFSVLWERAFLRA